MLESQGHVGEAKGHDHPLKQTIVGVKQGLLLVSSITPASKILAK